MPAHFLDPNSYIGYGQYEKFDSFKELKLTHSDLLNADDTPLSSDSEYYISSGSNWHIRLADTIKKCDSGSSIAIDNESMLELAKSAHQRMCPEKQIEFKIF